MACTPTNAVNACEFYVKRTRSDATAGHYIIFNAGYVYTYALPLFVPYPIRWAREFG
jgi:hypothetical protein